MGIREEKTNDCLYIKKNKKYIPMPSINIMGETEGLWLLVKNESGTELTKINVHEIKNAAKFADLYKENKENLASAIRQALENLDGFWSINELADKIINNLTK